MDANILELLKQQPFIIDDDRDDQHYYITIKCKNVDVDAVCYEVVDGQLNIKGANDMTSITNSIYLGSQYSDDDLQIKKSNNRIDITILLKED